MLSITLTVLVCFAAENEDLTCWREAQSPAAMAYAQLQQQAYAALQRREATVEQLATPEQIRDYQQRMREFFVQQLGGLPARTPLESRVVGTIEGTGYRIEKVIFASRPQHHVTAALFLPPAPGPHPAVVVSSGHSRTAKSAGYNQRFGIALARNGIAALCYDPIGQGERSQLLTPQGQPRHASTTREHFLVGVGSILVGANTASYRVWDGMRAIDYLQSRADIDGSRIGFTGCSGGGTLTSYVMALDDRVACAAPACYLTTFQRLLETIGPQDAEQNIYSQIAAGMDQPDYVLMRAPRPTLISATTGDFFSIQGAWENHRQANRIFTRLGHPQRVALVEADGPHGVQPANLTAIVRWMRRWLLDKDDAIELAPIAEHPERQLWCTETGQVLALPGERSVFDLNIQRQLQLAPRRREFWRDASSDEVRQRIRQIAGVRPVEQIGKLTRVDRGKVQREQYHIDKQLLTTPAGLPLPSLTFHPQDPSEDVYVYVHAGGKHVDGAAGGPIESLVEQGFVVVAVDLRGYGENAPDKRDPLLGDWKAYFLAYLLGKSMVGIRAEEIIASGQWAAHYKTQTPRHVHLVGVGPAAVPALHAAALAPGLFTSLKLTDAPPRWTQQLGADAPADILENAVHGALQVYDLPDLQRLFDKQGE